MKCARPHNSLLLDQNGQKVNKRHHLNLNQIPKNSASIVAPILSIIAYRSPLRIDRMHLPDHILLLEPQPTEPRGHSDLQTQVLRLSLPDPCVDKNSGNHKYVCVPR